MEHPEFYCLPELIGNQQVFIWNHGSPTKSQEIRCLFQAPWLQIPTKSKLRVLKEKEQSKCSNAIVIAGVLSYIRVLTNRLRAEVWGLAATETTLCAFLK